MSAKSNQKGGEEFQRSSKTTQWEQVEEESVEVAKLLKNQVIQGLIPLTAVLDHIIVLTLHNFPKLFLQLDSKHNQCSHKNSQEWRKQLQLITLEVLGNFQT